jgi:ABC-2 type transport system permease protein
MNARVILAVFKRNFISYFSSPIGYVFICAFVLLSGFAAFWPNDFFNNNLATLDQLNRALPWIMLVFIPAITMGIWAEERRQGTDELLLTLPGSDLDVVIGKYLAALAIFTVALLFSLSNVAVLMGLGNPDVGVLIANYIGYWLVGAAMLAVGMVASFFTGSLTVAFILALALNAPLVFAAYADAIIPWDGAARFIGSLSVAEQFRDFGRGLVTLSGVVFFLSIIAVSLYVSMILIGRRHWVGSPHGRSLAGHYLLRTIALVALAIGINVLVRRIDTRVDLSAENVNSLSPQTRTILANLKPERPVSIEAFVSPRVPDEYVQARLDLLSMLREVDARAGDNVIVHVHETQRFSDEEADAEQQYGIRPRAVQSTAAGRIALDQISLGAAFRSGLDKVVVPFFDRGIPAEYEIVRSIATVSQQQRRKVGVLTTDAKLFGGFDMERMASRPNEQVIEELRKQYDVEQVNPDAPITQRFDVLLAVQPSSMTPTQLEHFLAAVRSGQPTAIFEDPFPYIDGSVPATSQPRMPARQNPFQQQPPPEPKGDISPLWQLLGVEFSDAQIVWQDYNPYPRVRDMPQEFVFVGAGSGAAQAFSAECPITSGMQQMLTVFPGSIQPIAGGATTVMPLLQTGSQTGVVDYDEIIERNIFGQATINQNRRLRPTGQTYTLAAHITAPANPAGVQQGSDDEPATGDLNVVLVSDIDVLYGAFFAMRAAGSNPNAPIDLQVDNVGFVLNTLDYLAGDDRFIELRKRRPAYRTLTKVEQNTEAAREKATQQRDAFQEQFNAKRDEEQRNLEKKLEELQQREGLDPQQMIIEVSTAQEAGQKRLEAAIARFERERDQKVAAIERDLALETRRIQNRYKLAAIALPPIPPLVLGAFVFARRRSMEQLGVPKARLK